jgi:putative radical SAM enzyme (TIGR03279 family)
MIILIRAFPAPLDQLYEWRPGDHITHLDGRPLEDILDLYYYQPEGESTTLRIQRKDGEAVNLSMDPSDIDSVTGCFAPMEFKTCACNCVFCFIDQNPAGMRDQIYVKDEDYRFSFLYGNYITLTSLGRKGLARIIEQRMSPLFVSVHATDIDVRTRMLGIKRRIDVLAILQELGEAGIEIHTQVVLCPGWNEGPVLQRTFQDLLTLAGDTESGGVRSLAIVPVGLSAHRRGLTNLDPVTPELAASTIGDIAAWQETALAETGERFVYLSDEFYLLAGLPFPPVEHYDEFWQIDNAIGLTPRLRETWSEDLARAREEDQFPIRPLTVLTGELAAEAWEREFQPVFHEAGAPAIEVIPVRNTFYGNSVTVAGLLSGQDLRRALLELPAQPARTVVLSPRVLNADGLTLDGLTLDQLGADQPHELLVGEEEAFVDFWIDLR